MPILSKVGEKIKQNPKDVDNGSVSTIIIIVESIVDTHTCSRHVVCVLMRSVMDVSDDGTVPRMLVQRGEDEGDAGMVWNVLKWASRGQGTGVITIQQKPR